MESCSTNATSSFTITIIVSGSLLLLLSLSIPPPSIAAAAAANLLCHPQDENALLQIKAGLNSPDPFFASWKPNTDCCSWDGVGCQSQKPVGRVFILNIFNIIGGVESVHISPAIGDLQYLAYLAIDDANIAGTIPPTITNLKYLFFLSLSNNRLSGPIPEFLNQCKELSTLDLSYNNLSGTLPPALSKLSKLYIFQLNNNQLAGPIPESWGKFAGVTPSLNLSYNSLNGTLPKTFGTISRYCHSIDLSYNDFVGDASLLFGAKKCVDTIYLSSNKFEFDFSNIELPNGLNALLIDHNLIYGNIPKSFTRRYFVQFNVSHNDLCGAIPQGGSLQSFDSSAYDHNKCLCGDPLPPCK